MSTNEFNCLTNALLQASLRANLPVAYALPGRVRDILAERGLEAKDVSAVMLHQCPQPRGIIDYKLEVFTRKGLVKLEAFQGSGLGHDHDSFRLYDRLRDGTMTHTHLVH